MIHPQGVASQQLEWSQRVGCPAVGGATRAHLLPKEALTKLADLKQRLRFTTSEIHELADARRALVARFAPFLATYA